MSPIKTPSVGLILILSTSVISGILCAQIQASSSDKAPATSAPTTANPHPTTSAPKPTTVASAALSVATPFGANLKSLVAAPAPSSSGPSGLSSLSSANSPQPRLEPSQLDALEAKSAFADDSLWRLPFGVDDLNEGSSQQLASKSAGSPAPASGHTRASQAHFRAAELDDMDDDDDDEQRPAQSVHSPQVNSALLASLPSAPISAAADLKAAAGYHYPSAHSHQGYGSSPDYYGKYFQYAGSPYPYAWEFGYRRGNPYHTIERYEHGNGPHFKTKVKWSDKYGGHGVHVWDYNHDDHYANHYGHNHYDSHAPGHYEHQQHGYHAAHGHH